MSSCDNETVRMIRDRSRRPALQKLKFKSRVGGAKPPQLKLKKKNVKKSNVEQDPLSESTSQIEEPKIKLKKNITSKQKNKPIQFGKDGLPLATRENLDRMTMEEIAHYCQEWTLDKHLNALIIELTDYIKVSQKSTKKEKCQAILQYKKDFPSGVSSKRKDVSYDDTYESYNWRPEKTSVFRGKRWVLPNNPDFKSEIMARYSEYRLNDKNINMNKVDPDDPNSVLKYQAFVERIMDPRTPYRGLLVYHGLGSGKTRTAVNVSTRFLMDRKKVLVLLPGALRSNFIVELYTWGSREHGISIPNYKKLSDTERASREKATQKVISNYYDILTYNERGVYDKLKELVNPDTGYLENRLIIVDEIHNLVSRMSKATNLSRLVYHFLMERTYNCKFLFLSGTPLLNNAYELSILFNVLRGKFRTQRGFFTAFPEAEEEFNDKFVNIYDKSVFNKKLFMRRISGLVSYYAGSTDKKGMPEIVRHPTSKLPMSGHQFQLYVAERQKESRKESGKVKKLNVAESTGSAFRTYSRMVCNFAFPPGIIRPKPVRADNIRLFNKYRNFEVDASKLDMEDIADEISTGKEQLEGYNLNSKTEKIEQDVFEGKEKMLSKKQREETYVKLLQEALITLESMKGKVFSDDQLPLFAPKMWKIMQNIRSGGGSNGLVYIYTEFRILEGVTLMGSVLEYNGYEKISYAGINSFEDFKRKYPNPTPRYGIISSDEDSKQRKLLMEIYNHKENAHGEYVKVILGTSASSEGISLKRVQQIHIMEPYWNMVRNDQVEGRGVRYLSHIDMPEDEQYVHIYTYQMTLTPEQEAEIVEYLDNPKEADSTDEHIHKLALMKHHINSQFLKMIKEASVDCGLNFLVNVKKDPELHCMDLPKDSTNYLYVPDINKDPEDQEYMKDIKYETFLVNQLKIGDQVYGYKVYQNGRPVLDPPYITHEGKIYHQVITLYDTDLLENGIEVKRKYYVVGTNILVSAS